MARALSLSLSLYLYLYLYIYIYIYIYGSHLIDLSHCPYLAHYEDDQTIQIVIGDGLTIFIFFFNIISKS
jgi:hypothetical protein